MNFNHWKKEKELTIEDKESILIKSTISLKLLLLFIQVRLTTNRCSLAADKLLYLCNVYS